MSFMLTPKERLKRWMTAKGYTQAKCGDEIGCSQVHVSELVLGTRSPGRRVANNLEAKTADWDEGPIRSMEWDLEEDVEDAKDDSLHKKAVKKKRAA